MNSSKASLRCEGDAPDYFLKLFYDEAVQGVAIPFQPVEKLDIQGGYHQVSILFYSTDNQFGNSLGRYRPFGKLFLHFFRFNAPCCCRHNDGLLCHL